MTADDNSTDRYERGMAFFRSVNPSAAEAMQQVLGDIAPDLMRYAAEFPFGDLYTRDDLDIRLRQTATLSALACGGHMAQLKIHLQIARNIGLSRDELVAIFMQLAPYAGFPVAINAVLAVKEVFEDEKPFHPTTKET